ncbi:MAG: type II toxin-antitoxin system VapC family toxin [Nitrososphaerales archaeon]
MWAYYFDKDSLEHKFVVNPVDTAIKKEQILTNTVIVMELSHFLIRNLGSIVGGEKINFFLSFPLTVIDLDYKAILGSIEELKRYSHLGIGGRDATILYLIRKSASKKILTHDAALKRVDWLEVIDPIPLK